MPHKRAKKSVREQQREGRGADLAPPGNGMGISTERIPKSAARVLDAARIRAEYKQMKRAWMQMEGGAADADADHTGGAPKPPPQKKRRKDAGTEAERRKVLKTKGKGKEEQRRLVDAQAIEIQPGESLKHFNRRVEDHMRPLVQSAMRASAATERKEKKVVATSSSPSVFHTPSTAAATAKNKTQQPLSSSSSDTRKISKASEKDAPPSTTARRDDDGRDDDHRPKEFAVVSSAAPRRLNDIAMAPPELKKFPRGVKTKQHNSSAGPGPGPGSGVLSMAQRVMMEAERESAIKRYREMKERKTNEADRTLLAV